MRFLNRLLARVLRALRASAVGFCNRYASFEPIRVRVTVETVE